MKRQDPQAGDLFIIEIGAQYQALGQVLELVPMALNSVGVAVWLPRSKGATETVDAGETPLAVLLTTPDSLRQGIWQIRRRMKPMVPVNMRPYETFRSSKWVGAKIVGSGIVQELLAACVGLKPWDDWANSRYLDGLLYPGQGRPIGAVFKNAP